MKFCIKCNKEFVPSKGFINYCSWECRSSREFSEESKRKKSEKTKKHWETGGIHTKVDWAKVNGNPNKVESHKDIFFLKTEERILSGEKVWIGTIKKYLIRKHGHYCWMCKLKEWTDQFGGKVPISLRIDHIDGNNKNNDLLNLRLICGNCDSLLPTYCSKNIGRYSKIKSIL